MVNEILLIFLLFSGLFYWYTLHKTWEIALATTKARCRIANVQMLDGYVALEKIRLARDRYGQCQFRYTFEFEFTATGQDRYHGTVVFLGHRFESFYMEPHRLDPATLAPFIDVP